MRLLDAIYYIGNDDLSVSFNIILQKRSRDFILFELNQFLMYIFHFITSWRLFRIPQRRFMFKYFNWQNARMKNDAHYFSAIKKLNEQIRDLYTHNHFSISCVCFSFSVFFSRYLYRYIHIYKF